MIETQHPSYEFIREVSLPEIDATAREYRHLKTGARVLSLLSDDTNKVFGITFRTPPADSTGIAHILEHSVLCGSRKYPVKEPFVELLKGSLQTFLNAMTYPDKTCYPVASENLKDFYNLIDVYLDAVLHPRITPETFLQEGWHYELEDENDPLVFKGVVFNEMKGVYSSPEDVLEEYSQRSLFPGTTYAVDSGGDPRVIPSLTYEQFTSFHTTLYHPSNAYIYFYGDDDPARRLDLLDAYLGEFDRLDVDSSIGDPEPFEAPSRFEYPYEPGEDSTETPTSLFTVNWLLPETTDVDANLALSVLCYALIGTPASPLRKALLDCGLGEDLTGSGFANYMKRMYFGTGLRGITEADIPRAEAVIEKALSEVAEDGLEAELLAAALNTLEFKMRESNTGGYPRGLAYMLSALNFWLYDADPLEPIRFEAPLQRLKQRLEAGEPLFQGMVRSLFLENPHRTTVLLRPKPGVGREEAEGEANRLRQVREGMSVEDIRNTMEQTRSLLELQETPDPPEDLARIPSLTREDLDPAIRQTPTDIATVDGVPIHYHDLFTNRIVYFDIGFDLRSLPADLLPLVSLFGRSLLEMDTATESFVSLSNRIGKVTGGLGASSVVLSTFGSPDPAVWMFLRGKAVPSQAEAMLDIVHDVLLTTDFSDRDRFRQLVLEDKAGYESNLIPGGTGVADTRMRAGYSGAGWYNEQFKGVTQLFFLRELAETIESDWASVKARLETLRDHLVRREQCVVNVTVDGDTWSRFQPAVHAFLQRIPASGARSPLIPPARTPQPEGLTIPAKVNYVVKGINLFDHGYHLHGSIAAITNYLRAGYLWDRVRVQGGAYGASCSLDARSGIFGFGSYRDPNLVDTIAIYNEAAAFLRDHALDAAELTKNVVGAIGSLDRYQLPDARGYSATIRHLIGQTDTIRQQFRDELLATTPAHVKAFADALDAFARHGTVVVVGSSDAIDAATPDLTGSLRKTPVL